MSKFKLPPLSPLAGCTPKNLCRVLKGNHVAPKYYLKIILTQLMVLIGALFHWIDGFKFRRKVNKYVFKESPLFIIGHWRSGTTLLHNILTKDPACGYVTTYQSVFPNNLKSKWLFKTFMRIFMPDERPGDQMKISVNLPQEDEYALSNMTHRSFYHFFYFPTTYGSLYNKYIRFNSLSESEQEEWKLTYQKMVIKALINTHGKRAILKNPVNTGRMLKLLEIFPSAKFIFLIRNPVNVYLSTKKFFSELFPTVNLEEFTNEDISKMILEVYPKLLQDYLSHKKQLVSGKLIEIRYEHLQEDPIKEVENIYKKFKLDDFNELQPVFQEYIDELKGHKIDSYTIDQKELDRVTDRLGFAMKHWNYKIPEDLNITGKRKKSSKKALAG